MPTPHDDEPAPPPPPPPTPTPTPGRWPAPRWHTASTVDKPSARHPDRVRVAWTDLEGAAHAALIPGRGVGTPSSWATTTDRHRTALLHVLPACQELRETTPPAGHPGRTWTVHYRPGSARAVTRRGPGGAEVPPPLDR